MANTYTSSLNIAKPAYNDAGWAITLNANADAVDAIATVGGLAVALKEVPSTSLNIKIAAGTYRKSDGTYVTYAGSSATAMTTAATNYVYVLDSTGVLTVDTGSFPATAAHVRLAIVVAGASTITSVTDSRVAFHSIGSAGAGLPLSGGTFADGSGVVVVGLGATNGTKIGSASTDKLGLWGVTPVVQPSGATQVAVGTLALQTITVSTGGTPTTTLAAATNSSAMTDSSTGTATTTVADVGASFSQAGLNNIHASLLARLAEQRTLNTVLINSITSLGTQLNNALADLGTLKTLANGLRTAGVSAGTWKGSA